MRGSAVRNGRPRDLLDEDNLGQSAEVGSAATASKPPKLPIETLAIDEDVVEAATLVALRSTEERDMDAGVSAHSTRARTSTAWLRESFDNSVRSRSGSWIAA